MIEVDDLSFTYPGCKTAALSDATFDVGEGEIFGFLGPSGAGKSTTQKILIGILKGYRGRARVLGGEVRHHGPDVYEDIGVSFEFPNVYGKLTAMENLTFFASLYAGKTEEPEILLKKVGLADAARSKVSSFSKGMKMRLNFCRALINRPRLLFLDEPTGGQDPGNAKGIRELILEERDAGTTVFLSTHNMKVAEELCDRVAFVVDGRIALIEAPRKLMLSKGERVARVEYCRDGETASADFPLAHLGADQGFIDLLQEGGVETIHTQEATLEDVFIDVTGRSLS